MSNFDKMDEMSDEMKKKGREYAEEVREKMKEAKKEIADMRSEINHFAKSHPWAVAGLSLGVGLILGMTIKSSIQNDRRCF